MCSGNLRCYDEFIMLKTISLCRDARVETVSAGEREIVKQTKNHNKRNATTKADVEHLQTKTLFPYLFHERQ